MIFWGVWRWLRRILRCQKDFCLDKVRVAVTWAFKTELGKPKVFGFCIKGGTSARNIKEQGGEEGGKVPIHKVLDWKWKEMKKPLWMNIKRTKLKFKIKHWNVLVVVLCAKWEQWCFSANSFLIVLLETQGRVKMHRELHASPWNKM